MDIFIIVIGVLGYLFLIGCSFRRPRCPMCGGTGRFRDDVCHECDGKGRVD